MYNYTTLYTELNQPCNAAHSTACQLFPKTTYFIQMLVYALISIKFFFFIKVQLCSVILENRFFTRHKQKF